MRQRIQQMRGDRGNGAERRQDRLQALKQPSGVSGASAQIVVLAAYNAGAYAIRRAASGVVQYVRENAVVEDSVTGADDGLVATQDAVPEMRRVSKADARSKIVLVSLLLGREDGRERSSHQPRTEA